MIERPTIAALTASIQPKHVMNTQVFRGGCLCGSIRYEATGEPYDVTHCHCADCRKSSAAAFVTWACFRRGDFRFLNEAPGEIQWSGRIRTFCPHCGTPLTFLAEPDTDEVSVTVCSLDDPAVIQPSDHTWVQDQLPWIKLPDGLPTFSQAR